MIHLLRLVILTICLSSCGSIDLDWYSGNSKGYIENSAKDKIKSTDERFDYYSCLHNKEAVKLAKYVKSKCVK